MQVILLLEQEANEIFEHQMKRQSLPLHKRRIDDLVSDDFVQYTIALVISKICRLTLDFNMDKTFKQAKKEYQQ
jgi:hypothetical protein